MLTVFLVSNDTRINKQRIIQDKKIKNLGYVSQASHDPDKVIFNYSKLKLTDTDRKLLSKGLSYCLPPKKADYLDNLTPFELLYRDTRSFNLPTTTDEFVKCRIKDTAYSILNNYDQENEQNLTKDEHQALKSLASRKDIIIQRADKGNTVVIIDKDVYINRMKTKFS